MTEDTRYISLIRIKNEMGLSEHSYHFTVEELTDDDSLSDAIYQYTESHIDGIPDIFEWARNDYDAPYYFEQAAKAGLYDDESIKGDIVAQLQIAERDSIQNELYEGLDDIIAWAIFDHLERQEQKKSIDRELADDIISFSRHINPDYNFKYYYDQVLEMI